MQATNTTTIAQNNKTTVHFLIVRFSSIGDIILTTPIVRCLKQQVVGCKIHYVVKAEYATLVKNNPHIDKVIEYTGDWDIMMRELKANKYNYIIDLHHNVRSLRLKKQLNVPAYSFNKLNIQKWLLTNFKINMLPQKHIVDRYFDAIKKFNVVNDGNGLNYFIPETDEVKQSDIPSSHLFGYIGLAIGAAHATKKMPLNKLKELCSKINYPIILLGGKEDVTIGDELAKLDSGHIYNSCGKFNINESADLVRKAKLIITHDTGLMHIAAAFKKPIISIWGNTVPAFGMYPYYGNASAANSMFQVDGLKCRPCSKIGHNKCPKKHFNCMQQQNVDAIVSAAKKMINIL